MNQPFNRVFKPYAAMSVDQVHARLRRDASVLDLMMDDSGSLNNRLGAEDQRKMGEYLDSILAIEQRVKRANGRTNRFHP